MPLSTKHGKFIGHEEPAYTVLLRSVFHGDLSQFVSTKSLLASWKIWDEVRSKSNAIAPRIYFNPTKGCLNINVDDSGIHYISDDTVEHGNEKCFGDQKRREYEDKKMLGHPLFVGDSTAIVDRLAFDIYKAAQEAIASRGTFHLAVSGGQSPILLFHKLVSQMDFPWHFTHLWQVDERCAPAKSHKSNYRMIFRELLSHVPIPHNNIHPMNVHGQHGLCEVIDNAASSYSQELSKVGFLDFIILGLGSDGHTASLFPRTAVLQETSKLVAYSNAPHSTGSRHRMTLTYPTLSASRKIAIFILGDGKKNILSQLLGIDNIEAYKEKYPILGVVDNANQNALQTFTWYIDEKSMRTG